MQPDRKTSGTPSPARGVDLPPGDHPLEIAARSGFGPLSPQSTTVWHGNALPCVTCGHLVRRDATECPFCEQDLSREMLERMRVHAGPWYVLEHVRPFPGVSLDRIVRQINRGLITETSIVRGPSTDYQWRFAVETPTLCRFFLRCWRCHAEVTPTDTACARCETPLIDGAAGAAPAERTPHADGAGSSLHPGTHRGPSAELDALREALRMAGLPDETEDNSATTTLGGIRPTWIVGALLAAAVLALFWLTSVRTTQTGASATQRTNDVVPLPVAGP